MTQQALVLASRWSNSANRRREGLRAAHGQDAEVLTDLLLTYMRLKSSRGARTSTLTLDHYAESLRRFLAFTGPPESPTRALNQLSAEDFEMWLLTMQSEGLSASSVKRHLYGVRNLMRALVWAGVLDADPSAGVRPPSETTAAHSRKRALETDYLTRLLKLPAELHPTAPGRAARDTCLLMLGGVLGLRAAEIVGLNTTDVDLSGRVIRVRGKGGKERLVPLTGNVQNTLKTWISLRGSVADSNVAAVNPDQPLLISLTHRNLGGRLTTKGGRDIAEAYYRALGLPREMWGLHTLRRTAGTQLYRATRDLHVVADVLGHSSVNTSAIYAKMDSQVRREALEAAERLRSESAGAGS